MRAGRHYWLVQINWSLRVTLVMATGMTDALWSIEDIVASLQ
jgi:hypothetical protein